MLFRILLLLSLVVSLKSATQPIDDSFKGVSHGPLVCLQAKKVEGRELSRRLSNFKLMVWNMDYFQINDLSEQDREGFNSAPYTDYESNFNRVRTKSSLNKMARILEEVDADVILGIEISDLASFVYFLRNHMKGKWNFYSLPSNQRNSNLGFLVKGDLPFDIGFESYRDVRFKNSQGEVVQLFVRDVPVLKLRMNRTLALLGAHLKSAGKAPAYDPLNGKRRTVEANGLARIRAGLVNSKTYALAMGDFNCPTGCAEELEVVRTGAVSAFEILGVPQLDRVTHSYHKVDRATKVELPAKYSQLDEIFIDERLSPLIHDARVYRYKTNSGKTRPLPTSFAERDRNLSDHYPVVVTLDLSDFFLEPIP